MTSRRRLLLLAAGLVALLGAVAAGLLLRLDRQVRRAASVEAERSERVRPLAFAPLARPETPLAVVGDGRIRVATVVGSALYTAGGSGIGNGDSNLDVAAGLPTLRASAVASWRGTPVWALAQGGWGRIVDGGIEEASSAWGRLQVRAFLETPGGELLIGARQGLFRAAFGANEIERLDTAAVRALVLLDGGRVAAGGETGLRLVPAGPGSAAPVGLGEPWVEALGWDGSTLVAATPSGVFTGVADGTALARHPRGGDANGGVLVAGRFWFVPSGDAPAVASLLGAERREEATPERFARLLEAAGSLLADGPSGLWRRDPEHGWSLLRKRDGRSLPSPHVNALAVERDAIWAGFFDGGIARADGPASAWTPIADREPWGVNALLPAAGALYAATLRGAFRVEKGVARRLDGAGGAFSLALTESGLAVGYGQGVLLPENRLLSAFHGLPGNQAFALARSGSGRGLWVGTPTGLGRIENRRVVSAARPGEGKLPHPWVTALAPTTDGLLVATYGGGLALERDPDGWSRYPETSSLRVNAGALVVDPSGRAWAGTQGQGLWASDPGRTRFARALVPLPSPNVFSLALHPEASPTTLLVGTDEGLAFVPLQEN